MKANHLLMYHLVLWSMIFLSACSPRQTAGSREAYHTESVITLTKGPCFGTCPVFTLEVFRDGQVIFRPRFYTAVADTSYSCWDMKALIPAFRAAPWDTLQESYAEPVADIPSTTLTYNGKTIRWNIRAPQVLYDLEQMLIQRCRQEGWLSSPAGDDESGIIPGEYILQLRDPSVWANLQKRHETLALRLIRQLNQEGSLLLVHLDIATLPAQEALARLRKDSDVVAISPNHKVELRD